MDRADGGRGAARTRCAKAARPSSAKQPRTGWADQSCVEPGKSPGKTRFSSAKLDAPVRLADQSRADPGKSPCKTRFSSAKLDAPVRLADQSHADPGNSPPVSR